MFVLAFNNTNNADKVVERNSRQFFFPIVNITNVNVLIDGKKFYDQLIGDQIKKYGKVKKNATGQGYDYTRGRWWWCPYY